MRRGAMSWSGWLALLALVALHAAVAKDVDPYAPDAQAKGTGRSPVVLVAGVMGTQLVMMPNFREKGFRAFITGHLNTYLSTAADGLTAWRWHGRRFASLGSSESGYYQSREVIRKWLRVARLHKDSSRAYRDFVEKFCKASRDVTLTSHFDLGALDANALIQWLTNDNMFTRHKDEEPREKLVDLLVMAYREAFLEQKNKTFWLNKEWFGGYLALLHRTLSSWVNTEDNLFAFVAGLEWDAEKHEFVAALPGVQVVAEQGAAIAPEFHDVCTTNTPFPKSWCPTRDGLAAIEHLSSQKLIRFATREDSFADLIEWLVEKQGYTRGKDLLAQPYDWRMSPQQADMDMSLRNRIIHAYYNGGRRPVTVIAHSMGTIYAMYALEKMDQKFKDKYVHSFIAAGGPLAGAAEVMDGIVQGTKHLDKFVDREYMRAMQRMVGPLYLMAPREGANTEYTGPKNMLVTEAGQPLDTSGKDFVPWNFKDKTVFTFKDRKFTGSDADLEALFSELNAPNKNEGTLVFFMQDARVRKGGLFDRKRDVRAVMVEAGEYEPGMKHKEWSTFVVKDTNEPVWMDSIRLGYTDNLPPAKIVLKLIDDDGVGMDETLGTVTFHVRDVFSDAVKRPSGLGYQRTCMEGEVRGRVEMASACFMWYWAPDTPSLRKHAGGVGEDMRYPRRLKMLERDCVLNQMCAIPPHAQDVFHFMRNVNKNYPYPGVETLCAYSDSEDTIDSVTYEHHARYQREHLEVSSVHTMHPGDGTVPRYSAQAPCMHFMQRGLPAGLVRSAGTHGGMKHNERMLSFLKTHLSGEKKTVPHTTTTSSSTSTTSSTSTSTSTTLATPATHVSEPVESKEVKA